MTTDHDEAVTEALQVALVEGLADLEAEHQARCHHGCSLRPNRPCAGCEGFADGLEAGVRLAIHAVASVLEDT